MSSYQLSLGKQATKTGRQMFTLPVRLGGLGIANPTLKADGAGFCFNEYHEVLTDTNKRSRRYAR